MKHKCTVCGAEFALVHERHYIVRDDCAVGLAVALGNTNEPAMYDAFDCPECGCQNRVNTRMRRVGAHGKKED